MVTGQMSSGALISFFIYMLELGECLEVYYHHRCFYIVLYMCKNREVTLVYVTEHRIGLHRPYAGGWGC